MKKRTLLILLCWALLYCGCSTTLTKYKRISFSGETFAEEMKYVDDNTVVVNKAEETFPTQLPMYKITKHKISELEFQQMEEQLGITRWYWNDFDGYSIYNLVGPYADPERGYFYTLQMTDDELEKLAWETFHKIPFLEGEYTYLGITSDLTEYSAQEGEYVTNVTVSFRRVLDGIRVLGNDICDFSFDASGLQEITIALFDYTKIGTIDMVTLEEAEANIKTPDAFIMETASDIKKPAQKLEVDRVKLLFINQYSKGCTILQPIYNFVGTASLEDGTQTEFSSRIIAIPESYTYETE